MTATPHMSFQSYFYTNKAISTHKDFPLDAYKMGAHGDGEWALKRLECPINL